MAIIVDNEAEFFSWVMDVWAYQNGVKLDFIRPGRPVKSGLIESFNDRLRDECLNVHVFFDLADARQRLETWRPDYNTVRPYSSLGKQTPAELARRARLLRGSFPRDQPSPVTSSVELQPIILSPRNLTLAAVQ